jgi:hypothetical protein
MNDGSFNPAATYGEAVNKVVLQNSHGFRVMHDGEQNPTGQAAKTFRDDPQTWDGNRYERMNLAGAFVLPQTPNNRNSDATQVQAAAGVKVFYTRNEPKAVEVDAAKAVLAQTDYVCQWTELTMVGTPAAAAIVEGGVSGLRFEGAGLVTVTRL